MAPTSLYLILSAVLFTTGVVGVLVRKNPLVMFMCIEMMLNAANLARGLGVDGKTVAGYLDLLVDLLLVRRLPAWHRNIGQRLVKSPKVYVRDTGIAHALLGIRDKEALLGHPVVGQTWESFTIETLITTAPDGTEAHEGGSIGKVVPSTGSGAEDRT